MRKKHKKWCVCVCVCVCARERDRKKKNIIPVTNITDFLTFKDTDLFSSKFVKFKNLLGINNKCIMFYVFSPITKFRKMSFWQGCRGATEDLKHVLKPWMTGLSNHVGYNTIGPLLEVVISLQRQKHVIFYSYFRRFF